MLVAKDERSGAVLAYDCLAKGPVGLLAYWQGELQTAWAILVPVLGAPRSGQNSSYALSPFEVP